MYLIQSKQVEKLISGKMHVQAVPVDTQFAETTNVIVTDPLTTAAATAGDNGVAVPVQFHMDGLDYQEGFITTGRNLVEIFDSQKNKLADLTGNEIYGRLTFGGLTAEEVSIQVANSDFLYKHLPSFLPAAYADKAALLAEATSFQADYDVSNPVVGRNASEVIYAAEIVRIVEHTTTLHDDVAVTKEDMLTSMMVRATTRSPFREERALAAEEVKTRLGDNGAIYIAPEDIVNTLSPFFAEYEVIAPQATWTASERAYSQGYDHHYLIALSYNGSAVPTAAADSYAEIMASANAMSQLSDNNYRITFYSSVNGVETLYAFPEAVTPYTLDFAIPYLFTFQHLPFDFATGLKSMYVNDDPAVAGPSTLKLEQITVTDENEFDPLLYTFRAGTRSTLFVNGQTIPSVTTMYTVNIATNTIVWDEDEAGYGISVDDTVYLEYDSTGILHV
jgi:hypothetical protein